MSNSKKRVCRNVTGCPFGDKCHFFHPEKDKKSDSNTKASKANEADIDHAIDFIADAIQKLKDAKARGPTITIEDIGAIEDAIALTAKAKALVSAFKTEVKVNKNATKDLKNVLGINKQAGILPTSDKSSTVIGTGKNSAGGSAKADATTDSGSVFACLNRMRGKNWEEFSSDSE